MSSSYLYTVSNDILSSAAAALTQDRTGNPAPSRTNVSWGAPPVDACCNEGAQLNVNIDSQGNAFVYDFPRTVNNQTCVIVPRANFVVTLFRCVPTIDDQGNPPTAEALDTSAQQFSADLWALMSGLHHDILNFDLYTGQSHCNDVQVTRVTILEPSGGCGGIQARLSVLLNDAGPT